MNYLITYDISDDKRRTKVSVLLDSYGNRANFSVYECSLTKRELKIIIEKIEEELIDRRYDSIRFYHICQNCVAKSFEIGKREEPFESKDIFI
jgi:CRISPR-associated protein Cas2